MANSLNDFIQAAADTHLRDRFIAAAQEAGVPQAEFWVDQNRGDLTRSSVGDPGNADATIVSVYAYAAAVYKQTAPPPPGFDPAAVTDNHIRAAIQNVITPPAPEPAGTWTGA